MKKYFPYIIKIYCMWQNWCVICYDCYFTIMYVPRETMNAPMAPRAMMYRNAISSFVFIFNYKVNPFVSQLANLDLTIYVACCSLERCLQPFSFIIYSQSNVKTDAFLILMACTCPHMLINKWRPRFSYFFVRNAHSTWNETTKHNNLGFHLLNKVIWIENTNHNNSKIR